MTALSNVEMEAAVIGAMLIDPEIAKAVRPIIGAADFTAAAHSNIFLAICAAIDDERPSNPVALKSILEGDPALQELGGTKYLARLTSNPEGLLTAPSLAQTLADFAARRRAIDALNRPDMPLAAITDELSSHVGSSGIARRLPVIDFSKWTSPPPPRRSIWGDWIPLHQTTLLAGDGGVGKSLLAQQLATAVALGRSYLGKGTECRPAIYLTSEDDADELHRRQVAICAAMGCTPQSLVNRLHLVSLAGDEHMALARATPDGRMTATDRWRGLVSLARQGSAGLVVIDNATAAFSGDHNDLHSVARFLALLTGLAIEQDGAVVLLHHPNKAGGEWLGSVAWQNQVRARLQVKRPAEGSDPDARIIESSKANYGRSGETIQFRWFDGAFMRDDDLPASAQAQLAELTGQLAENEAFLRLLDICTERRINVSHAAGKNFAPELFMQQPEGRGWSKAQLTAAMWRLGASGQIEFDQNLWAGLDRHPRKGIRRTGLRHD